MIEVIKYGTKIFTKPKTEVDAKIKLKPTIYVKAIHNILTAMKGVRLFDRFGFNLPKVDKEQKTNVLFEYDTMKYNNQIFDWIDTDTNLTLTNHNLPLELLEFLNNSFDLEQE